MKLKSIALAGCAAVALGAMGAPAYATKAEDAREAKITQQLNQQQAQNPGSVPTAQTAANTSTDQELAANTAQPSDANADPNAKANASPVTRAATETGNEIDQAVGPNKPVTNAEMRAGVAVTQVSDPTKTLATAELKTRRGEAIGEVKAIEVNPDGSARAVKADVGGFLGMGEREVNIDASNLMYIKDRNILVTDMTKPQIQNLPPVSKTY